MRICLEKSWLNFVSFNVTEKAIRRLKIKLPISKIEQGLNFTVTEKIEPFSIPYLMVLMEGKIYTYSTATGKLF